MSEKGKRGTTSDDCNRCGYCGEFTMRKRGYGGSLTCVEHADLPRLDPHYQACAEPATVTPVAA